MGIVRNSESEHEKELAQWNTPRNQRTSDGRPGLGAIGFEKYPQMLYKAFRDDTGKAKCMESPPLMHMYLDMPTYMRAESVAKAFTDQCQLTVRSDAEYERARSDGWRDTAGEALEHFEALQREIADAAAEEQFRVRRMSDKAQHEFSAANAGDAHVPDPAAPKKKPGRPAKAVAAVA